MSATLATHWNAAAPRHARADVSPPVAVLAAYHDGSTLREVVVQRGAQGTALVIDRRAGHATDQRLVAHLAADEAPGNAALVCADYLRRVRARADCRPRPMTAADLVAVPFAAGAIDDPRMAETHDAQHLARLTDSTGCTYRVELVDAAGLAIPEQRWLRRPPPESGQPGRILSVREVIGQLERYEPIRAITAQRVLAHRRDTAVSVATLRAELERVAVSRIVLNRGLRETVLRTVARDQVSMSEIAIRCGRVKRDARGNVSGETSWLARRLGLLPEGGEARATPWIHADVLALIARQGLGLAPREVEQP